MIVDYAEVGEVVSVYGSARVMFLTLIALALLLDEELGAQRFSCLQCCCHTNRPSFRSRCNSQKGYEMRKEGRKRVCTCLWRAENEGTLDFSMLTPTQRMYAW